MAQKKFKTYVAFGSDLIDVIEEEDLNAVKESLVSASIPSDCIKVREWASEAEAKAYLEGLKDCDGWWGYLELNPEERFDKQVINAFKKLSTK